MHTCMYGLSVWDFGITGNIRAMNCYESYDKGVQDKLL